VGRAAGTRNRASGPVSARIRPVPGPPVCTPAPSVCVHIGIISLHGQFFSQTQAVTFHRVVALHRMVSFIEYVVALACGGGVVNPPLCVFG
jgi:hypothetical protein